MPHARLMTQPQDYTRLGIEPDTIAPWEVGRREDAVTGRSELWHFEAAMADGTTTAIAFCVVGPGPSGEESLSTVVNLFVTLPDGRLFQRMAPGSVAVSEVGTTRCELPFGPHAASGDLKTFSVTVDPIEGVGVELSYTALVDSYRPGGTAQIALSGDSEFHYAVHAVPRCEVTGTVTADGNTWDVAGQGYHDHQWTDADLQESWHHWLWGRFYSEHFTVVIYDLWTSERFGFTRIPIFGVLDETGAVIFDNRDGVESDVTTARDPESGKDYPKRSRYVFRDGARTFELDFEWTDELVNQDVYGASDVPPELGGGQRDQFDRMGIRPSYTRYRAEGTLTITEGSEVVTERGEMNYEFNYVGHPDSRAPIT